MNEHQNTNPEIETETAPAVEEVLTASGTADSSEEIQGDEFPDLEEVKRALEAALLAASEPLQTGDLKKLFDGKMSHDTLRILLEEIRAQWSDRSVELSMVANGWRFRVRPEYQKYIDRLNPEKPPKYSRAVLETLAIIAYRQPTTRGDIEDIRGVSVSPGILKALEERGWIDVVGHKDVPGRPALFATTKKFLDDLNLRSLEELPSLLELETTLDMHSVAATAVNRALPLEPVELEVGEDAGDLAAGGDAVVVTTSSMPPDQAVPTGEVDESQDNASETSQQDKL